ncbi:hypothetical protein [Streptomyces odonnellii]|uniref:hypothetical protein n=1 Tax=Streptomyces odonnellii TaxID=1417980 RepID=UPI000ACCE0E3|nr:hypothetical protein [Streptomyces odonnellii]
MSRPALKWYAKLPNVATPTQQTEVRTVYITCRLGKSELNRLFSLAPEGIPAASVSISTQRDSTRYRAGTLTDLVDHVRNSNASGNLNVWDNLALEAADTTGDRMSAINIDTERVVVQVSGTDATWVHGQAARIKLLLEAAGGTEKGALRARKDLLTMTKALVIAIPMFAISFLTGGRVFPEEQLTENMQRDYYVAICTMVGTFGLYWIGFKIVERASRALLIPTAEVPHGSWWGRASNADKISLSSLAVAALSFFVALATLGKDFMK